MCEDFSARPYSSEQACLHEVEQSDIYIVLVGKDFGYETPEGVSVTQAEFRAAQATNRPILAFIQRVDGRDDRQQAFLREVEAYQGGVFRAAFSAEMELNNEVIKALRHFETMSQSITEDDLKARIGRVLSERRNHREDPELVLAFMPQPERMVDIITIEQQMDHQFNMLCQAGVTQLKDGYKLIEHAHWTGFESGKISVVFCPDGLTLLTCNPTLPDDSFFAGRFSPPELIEGIANGFYSLVNARSGYFQLALRRMENAYVATPPKGTSMTMSLAWSRDSEAEFSRLFVPLTQGNYEQWVAHCVNRFARIFKYGGD